MKRNVIETPRAAKIDQIAQAMAEVPGRDGWPLLMMTWEDLRLIAAAALDAGTATDDRR